MSIHPEQHPLDGKLEPETKDCFNDRAPLYSIAISLKRIADAPSEAAARITELEGEVQAGIREILALRDDVERAEAQCRVLQEALQPFAEDHTRWLADDGYDGKALTIEHFTRAVQALSLSGGGGREKADRLISEGHERFVEKHGFRQESPSADAGPYPRSHEQQRPLPRQHQPQSGSA